MKNSSLKRITAIIMALSVFLASFILMSPAASAAEESTGTPVTPIGTGVISTEDYYRLLYFNEVSLKNTIYDFEKTGFNHKEITYKDVYLNMLKSANIALSVLGAVGSKYPIVSSVVDIGQKFILTQQVDRVNVNNKKMLNQLAKQIEDVYNAISSDIEKQTEVLSQKMSDFAVYLANQMEAEQCAAIIKSFNESAFGGSGYGKWKRELYDSYAQLVYYSANGASEADIKEAYDQLYVTAEKYKKLVSLMTAGEYADDVSIQDSVYKYYLLKYQNGTDIPPQEIVNECIAFTDELYTTYIFAKTCMNICHRYQLETLKELYGDNLETKGYVLSDSVNTLDRRVPYYSVIKPFIENHGYDIQALCAEISRYYTKILNLCESYTILTSGVGSKVIYNQIVTDVTDAAQTVTRNGAPGSEKYVVRNNFVRKGDLISLNTIPQKLSSSFAQKYTFVSSDESVATVSQSGVVTVLQDKSFSITLKYGNYAIYTMSFTAGNAFSGGTGSSESPFIIADADDLNTLASNKTYWAKGYHFMLTSDIDVASLPQIGSSNDAFYGVFDGNGYTVSGLRGRSLFGFIGGTVKNLTLKNVTVTDGYVIEPFMWSGALCEYNGGTIENVHIRNCTVDVTNKAALNSPNGRVYENVTLYAGGIAAENGGVIKGSSVSGTTVKGYQTNGIATGGALGEIGAPKNNNVNIGGITAYNRGTVSDCLTNGNTQYIYIKSVSAYNNYIGVVKTEYLCTANFIMGGITGTNAGHVTRCASYDISSTHKWDYGTQNNVIWPAGEKYIQAKSESITELVAKNITNGTDALCFTPKTALSESQQKTLKAAGWRLGTAPYFEGILPSSISIYKEPAKVIYDLNTPLNLAGLTLVTDTGEYVTDGYTVLESFSDSGEKTVTVSWNDMQTSFKTNVICHHGDAELIAADNADDEKVVCRACNETLAYLEGSRAPSYAQHEHEYSDSEILRHPTHTEEGERSFTCTKCGESITEAIPRTPEHTFNKKAEEDRYAVSIPSCGEKCEYYYSCACGEAGTQTFFSEKAYEHKYTDEHFNENEHWFKCERCKHQTEKEPHSFGVWHTVTEPDGDKDGTKERTCYDCSYTELGVIEAHPGAEAPTDSAITVIAVCACIAAFSAIAILIIVLAKKRR